MIHTIIILLQFSNSMQTGLEAQVEREMNVIFARTQVQFVVARQQQELDLGPVDDVVHVNVTGACVPRGTWRGGTLATTLRLSDELQSFMSVDCDGLAAYVGYPPGIGKALARVLAHEMLHYLLQEPHHDGDGLFKPKLSRKELVEGVVQLAPDVVRRVNGKAWPPS